mmetsp:Transcript_4760/g.8894  ORF Transcript_4760/g.8894 Transcript_4760/m.8894 type:complete len:145 (-) Transcript_4760:2545-2979(-)
MERQDYWCYKCNSSTRARPDLTCSYCHSEFIEVYDGDQQSEVNERLASLQSNLGQFTERLTGIVQSLQDLIRQIHSENREPASEEEIQALPEIQKTGESCAICAEPQNGIVKLLPCSHTYHENCIVHWLKIQRTCPQCRRDISA